MNKYVPMTALDVAHLPDPPVGRPHYRFHYDPDYFGHIPVFLFDAHVVGDMVRLFTSENVVWAHPDELLYLRADTLPYTLIPTPQGDQYAINI